MVDASKKKTITMVMEDYLEAIYELGQEKKVVRVRDICRQARRQNAYGDEYAEKI